jgi:hypothetical protein
MQKRLDEITEVRAQLDLANSKVGDVVPVESHISPSTSKVRLKLRQIYI